MLTFKNILVPTDFSEAAAKSLQLALAVANGQDATLHLCHILAPPAMGYGEVLTDLTANAYADAAKKQLDEVAVPAGVKTTRRLIEGDPPTEIVRLAKELSCDLIVLGSHGRTGLMRLLMGSVAEHVLRHAPCPVLTLKA